MEWKDCTSYSRSDKERVPRTYEFRGERIRLVVTRKYDIETTWFGCCFGIDIDGIDLHTNDLEEAKSQLVAIVKERLMKMSACLEELNNGN